MYSDVTRAFNSSESQCGEEVLAEALKGSFILRSVSTTDGVDANPIGTDIPDGDIVSI